MGQSLSRRRLLEGTIGGIALAAVPRAGHGDVPASRPLVFGVFPYLPALEIGRQFGPMASALSKALRHPLSLQTKSAFPAFQEVLRQGRYDIALLHPFLFADAVEVQDYRPLARLREPLAGVVVTRVERRVSSFEALRGETLAVPPPLSAVTQLVKQELKAAGLDGPEGVYLSYHRTKTACLHAVARGQATGCVVPGFFLSQLADFAPVALEPKFATTAIPGLLFAGHGRLGERLLVRAEQCLLGWSADPAGRKILASAHFSELVAVEPGDYDTATLSLTVDW